MRATAGVLLLEPDPASIDHAIGALRERFRVRVVQSWSEALPELHLGSVDVLVADAGFLDGQGAVPVQGAQGMDLPVILIANLEQVARAIKAVRRGASGYLRKPFLPEELGLAIDRALLSSSRKRGQRLEGGEVDGFFREHGLIGRSEAMRAVFNNIDRVARAETTVLLQGESGTGKELVARAIHHRSLRRSRRFVAVNCGAIPKELIESELFGHVEGAFSGATSDKRGLIEEAEGGTVLLDEVSELDLSLQVKLTRVLQEREIRRVGDTKARRIDVRFVAATNRVLSEEVQQGRFREDLYFRLQVYPIVLPPLRSRLEDLPDLVAHYLALFSKKLDRSITIVDEAAMRALEAYKWPGNVRELVNMIERAMLLESGDVLSLASFPALERERSRSGFWEPPVDLIGYRDYMDGVTQKAQERYLTKALQRSDGNVSQAAKEVGLTREALHRLLRRVGVDPSRFRGR